METTITHLPTPGAGLLPLCGEHRGFRLIDHDPNETTCADCLRAAANLTDDELNALVEG